MKTAVFCSDIHFRDNPPPCYRSMSKQGWLDYQMTVFNEVLGVAMDNDVPLFIAGDVFDKPEVSLRLIETVSEAISHSDVTVYPCYGQHDVFNHNTPDSFGTALSMLFTIGTAQWPEGLADVYSWGDEIQKSLSEICIAHKFVWLKKPFPNADEEGNVKDYGKYGYDILVFGDNHQPFISLSHGKTQILNCGSLIRQSQSEDHHPACYLWKDGMIETIRVTNRALDPPEFSISCEASNVIESAKVEDSVSFVNNVEQLASQAKKPVAKKALEIIRSVE